MPLELKPDKPSSIAQLRRLQKKYLEWIELADDASHRESSDELLELVRQYRQMQVLIGMREQQIKDLIAEFETKGKATFNQVREFPMLWHPGI